MVPVTVEGAEEQGECGQEGRDQYALFYVKISFLYCHTPIGSRVHLIPW